MSFRGLIVLLDEAISASDEKGLRKDWQKDMRGLLGAAMKQNKRAYTKRAAMPPAPKKADATKSPADQMKNAQRGNTGSSGSDVEGPKGGNRSSGFSGSLGSLGGGGGGGSSGGGMRGGGSGASGTITLGGGSKEKPKSSANPLRDAAKSLDKIEALLAKTDSKDAKDLLQMIRAKYSVRFTRIETEEYVQDKEIGNMQIVTLGISVDNWKGGFEFIITLNMADGGELKVSSEVIVDRAITSLDVLEGADKGDTVKFSTVVRLTDESSNALADFFHGIVINRDGVAFEQMLEDNAKTKILSRWAGQFAGQESSYGNPSDLPPGTYMLTDLEKQSRSATAMVYLRTEATKSVYNVELMCRDADGSIEISTITDGNGKKASLRDLNAALQVDLDLLDKSTPPDGY